MAARLQPDIIVMDIQMLREDRLAVTGQIPRVARPAVVTAHSSRAGQIVGRPPPTSCLLLRPPRTGQPEPARARRAQAAGTPIKNLAGNLGITVSTWRGHVKSLRHELGATSRIDAVLKGRGQGLIDD
jgi:DNA-binding NarL/FixJ family response regulator